MKHPILLPFLAASLTVAAQAQEAAKHSVETMPPAVVSTIPQCGDTAVDAGLKEIRVTFSKDMMTKEMWSICQVSDDSFPASAGDIHYLGDKRTCVFPVKLEPGKTYVLWFNTGKFASFRDTANNSAIPYLLVFKTRGASGSAHRVRTDACTIADDDGKFKFRMDEAGRVFLADQQLCQIRLDGGVADKDGKILAKLTDEGNVVINSGASIGKIAPDGTFSAAGLDGRTFSWSEEGTIHLGDEEDPDEMVFRIKPADSLSKRAASLLLMMNFTENSRRAAVKE